MPPAIMDELRISIHAPTRGATMEPRPPLDMISYFNPRSYKRSDGDIHIESIGIYKFQSTLLQEERPRHG